MSQVETANSPNKPVPSADIIWEGSIAFQLKVTFQVTPDTNEFFYVRAIVDISGSQSYRIESERVRATYGTVLLPFNMIQPPNPARSVNDFDVYGAYDIDFLDKITNTQNAISITLARRELTPLHPPVSDTDLPSFLPIVQLNKSMIGPQWLIGVRNIMLVDSTSTPK